MLLICEWSHGGASPVCFALGLLEDRFGGALNDRDNPFLCCGTNKCLKLVGRGFAAEATVASGTVIDPDGVVGPRLIRANQGTRPTPQTLVSWNILRMNRQRNNIKEIT